MVLGVTTLPDNFPRANRPVLATAIPPSVRGSFPGASFAKTATKNAAPVLVGPQYAPSPKSLGSTRVRMEAWRQALDLVRGLSRPEPENGRRSAPAVALRASPAAGAPAPEAPAQVPPPPSLPTPQPPARTASLPKRALGSRRRRGKRSPGPSPGRGPPRRSGLDKLAFSWKEGAPPSSDNRGRFARHIHSMAASQPAEARMSFC